MFFSEYIDAEAGVIPFGGRDKELSRLDNWLLDSERPRRMLLAGPAGRGKSALLVQWIKSLQERHLVNNGDQWLAFMPISIRSGTNRPDIFWPGLAYRLSEITGRAISLEATRTSDGFKYEVVDQLGVIGEANLSVLVILDGLDEALYGSFEFAIARETLRPNIRIIMSARWQVGDTNSEGWLKRLRWDRNVRYEVVNLDRLSVDDIDDVLESSDLPYDSLVEENAIASRLAVLTDGDPILVRYYAQDLWGLGQRRARIAISDLDNLKPGFYNYFEYWVSYQERLWADEGTILDRNEIDRVLSIMAFAHGPLTSRDLIELLREIHQIDGLLSEHRLLQPLRRFVIGSGKRDSGYVLSHPKLAEFLRNERFAATESALRKGFVVWGQKLLKSLNEGTLPPREASGYALQFLTKHFEDAGVSASEWMEFVENGWRQAWEHFEGGTRGFAGDVRIVLHQLCRMAPSSLAAQWRCALVLSSISSIGRNISDELVCAAVNVGVWSVPQAVHVADCGRTGEDGIALLIKISKLDNLTASQVDDIKSLAVERLFHWREWTVTKEQIPLLSRGPGFEEQPWRESGFAKGAGLLASHLKVEQVGELLILAREISGEGSRAETLVSLAPYLTVEQVGEAFTLAKEISDECCLSKVLISLAPYLTVEQVGEAFTLAKEMSDERFPSEVLGSRAEALVSLAPYLTVEQVGEAFILAKEISDERSRAEALGALAPHMTGEQKAEKLLQALSAAKAISDEWDRVGALCSLVPHLTEEQKAEVISEALFAAKALDSVWGLMFALCSLAPHLTGRQVGEAFTLAKEISNGSHRAKALGALAPQMTEEEIREALTLVRKISDKGARAEAFGSLAPYMTEDQVREALTWAREIGYENYRAEVLHFLSPHLTGEQAREALTWAKEINDESSRAEAIGSLAPHITGEQKTKMLLEALSAAKAISDERGRTEALCFLAPHLTEEQVGDALTLAKAISYEFFRAEVIGSLAPYMTGKQVRTALSASKASDDAADRAMALVSLARYFSGARKVEILSEALAIAKTIGDAADRTKALSLLAAHLTGGQKVEVVAAAWAAAKSIGMSRSYWWEFEALVPHMTEEQVTEALIFIKAINNEQDRAQELSLLAGRLTREQIAEALAAANAIQNKGARAQALSSLAPHLTGRQKTKAIADALAAANAIEDKYDHVKALSLLFPHLADRQKYKTIMDAVVAANAIENNGSKLEALILIAPHLTYEQRPKAIIDIFVAAKKIGGWPFARVLKSLAEYLTKEQAEEVIDASKMIDDEELRINTLAAVSFYMLPDKIINIFDLIKIRALMIIVQKL